MSQSIALLSPPPNAKPCSATPPPPIPLRRRLHSAALFPRKLPDSVSFAGVSSIRTKHPETTRVRPFAAAEGSPELVIGGGATAGKRKWNMHDVVTAGVVGLMHFLCALAPFCFSWRAFWVAFGLYVVTGLLGITLSFHRNLSHRSFKLPKWLEYFCAYCGAHALQVKKEKKLFISRLTSKNCKNSILG